jgi:signal transduction histidine kinase
MVGHDIRNPLQAIVSDLFLLKDNLSSMPECATKNEVTESLESIDKNIAYINKIVADLQDFSRKLNPEYSLVDMKTLVQNVVGTLSIPCNIKVDDETESIKFKTDANYARRVLTNLITNAVQAMPTGGSLTIKSLEMENENKVMLTVEDTGIGIPENVKPKLFTPMMTTKSKGQGLGLAVVKRLVEALHGTITFESQEGKGTKFIIELPKI